jgi:hypothetical protein
MAGGIEDLKVWRSEPVPDEWIKFNPNHPSLKWRVPYQGKWYTGDLNFARDWMGSGNIIKELDIKSPISLSKEIQNYPRHWTDSHLSKYSSKNITELLDDIKKLKTWVPTEGMGSSLNKLDQNHPFRDLYGKVINRPYDKPLTTKFEYFMRNPNLKRLISLVPPQDVVDKGSVNVWESIRKNLWRPNKYGGIFSGRGESWIQGILGLPKKIKYLNQLKKANVPMHSGINWAPAMNVLRTGSSALTGAFKTLAISDMILGTNFIGGGQGPTRIPREARAAPYSAAVGTPGNAPTSRFNRGGIASLVL